MGKPKLVAAALTDVGNVRRNNQDNFTVLLEQRLFIVADGMGGRPGGAVAAKIVVEQLPVIIDQHLQANSSANGEDLSRLLKKSIVKVSQEIWHHGTQTSGLLGMGTTAVVIYFTEDQAFVGHMGDSRVYLLRRGEFQQLTIDHTLLSILLQECALSEEQARTHPARGVLSRYVGMEEKDTPDIKIVELQDGDRFLLCSDGLTKEILDSKIAEIISPEHDPQAACDQLVAIAKQNGGRDNITAVIVDWKSQ